MLANYRYLYMEDINQGVQPVAEPTVTGVQPTAEPTQNNQQAEPNNPVANNQLQELETQLNAERTRAQNLEQLARQQQSRASHFEKQVQALAGTTPQADPIKAKAEAYAKKHGLNIEDAGAIISILREEMAPLMEANQRQQSAMQATTLIGDVLNAAYQQDPSLFSEQVYAEVQQQLRQEALQGANYITPEYALDHAAIIQSRIARAGRANPSHQMAPPIQPQRQSIPSFVGPPGGFTPAAHTQQKPINPLSAQFDKDIAARYGTK